jgi:hypothetical protein
MTNINQLGRDALIETLLAAGVASDTDDDRVFAGEVADRVLAAQVLATPGLNRAVLETWAETTYAVVVPPYYEGGDDPWVDERLSQLSALDDLIETFFPDEAAGN